MKRVSKGKNGMMEKWNKDKGKIGIME